MDERLKDTIAVRFSRYYISKIDVLIAKGVFKNRSDLVRTAISELVSKVEVMGSSIEASAQAIGND